MLDEPTASLPASDVEVLFDVIKRLKARGVGVVYVSHRLDEVFAIADRVTVLRDGSVVGKTATSELTMAELVRLIVGAELREVEGPPPLGTHGGARLAVSELMCGFAGPVDFQLAPGEIVGLAGLRGSGQEEVGRAIAGVIPRRSGAVSVDGSAVTGTTPGSARTAGIGFATSRREEESIATTLTRWREHDPESATHRTAHLPVATTSDRTPAGSDRSRKVPC